MPTIYILIHATTSGKVPEPYRSMRGVVRRCSKLWGPDTVTYTVTDTDKAIFVSVPARGQVATIIETEILE